MAVHAPTQVFEDFVPKSELLHEADADILKIHLPDFKKEQLRVQITKSGMLKVSGQRPKGGDRWIRFHKEFPISPSCNQNNISAKFERGILLVRQPKLTISAQKQGKLPEPEHRQPQKPAADDRKKAAEEQAKGDTTAKAVSESGLSQPQKPTVDGQKMGEEASKRGEEQAKREGITSQMNGKAVSEAEPKREEAKGTKGKASELTDAKSATERSVDTRSGGSVEDRTSGKSTSNKKGISDTRNAGKTESSGNLATKLRQPRKILNVALVVLVVVGIGLYVNNMVRSSREAEQ